jgi:hypothetical protein
MNKSDLRSVKMLFVLKGFTPETGFRVFAFDGIAEDRTRTEFKVRTDLSLIRTYGIRVQELPLLCRGLLERRDEGDQTHTLTFTEDEMRVYASNRAAERDAAEKRRSRRAPVPQSNGGAQEVSPSAMKMSTGNL